MNINQRMYDNVFDYVENTNYRLGIILFVGKNFTLSLSFPCLEVLSHVFPGLAFCIFSLLCGMLLGLFDRRAERILQRKESGTGEKIHIKDIKDFPFRLWVIFIVCVTYYVTVFPFIGLATLVYLYLITRK